MISFTKTKTSWKSSEPRDTWHTEDDTNGPLAWFQWSYLTFLETDEELEVIVEGSLERVVYIDWRNLESADNGDTTHYGGTVKLKIRTVDGDVDKTYQGWGDDRSDSIHSEIAGVIEGLLGDDSMTLRVIQNGLRTALDAWKNAKKD